VLAVTNDKGERRYEAELHRLKGELLLTYATEHDTETETCFHWGIDIDRQQAKSIDGSHSTVSEHSASLCGLHNILSSGERLRVLQRRSATTRGVEGGG
jgi:hypothetical protein